jgi:hypothetical protein
LNEEDVINILLTTYEAHFHLSGSVNTKQNFCFWAAGNPHERHQRPLHSDKVTVWCGVAFFGLIGPYFFEDSAIAAVTGTSDCYLEMLYNFLEPELRRRGIDLRNIWFQQDGATARTARVSMNVVREMFPQHIISRYGDVQWPACSPDLSPYDYFVGTLKVKCTALGL